MAKQPAATFLLVNGRAVYRFPPGTSTKAVDKIGTRIFHECLLERFRVKALITVQHITDPGIAEFADVQVQERRNEVSGNLAWGFSHGVAYDTIGKRAAELVREHVAALTQPCATEPAVTANARAIDMLTRDPSMANESASAWAEKLNIGEGSVRHLHAWKHARNKQGAPKRAKPPKGKRSPRQPREAVGVEDVPAVDAQTAEWVERNPEDAALHRADVQSERRGRVRDRRI